MVYIVLILIKSQRELNGMDQEELDKVTARLDAAKRRPWFGSSSTKDEHKQTSSSLFDGEDSSSRHPPHITMILRKRLNDISPSEKTMLREYLDVLETERDKGTMSLIAMHPNHKGGRAATAGQRSEDSRIHSSLAYTMKILEQEKELLEKMKDITGKLSCAQVESISSPSQSDSTIDQSSSRKMEPQATTKATEKKNDQPSLPVVNRGLCLHSFPYNSKQSSLLSPAMTIYYEVKQIVVIEHEEYDVTQGEAGKWILSSDRRVWLMHDVNSNTSKQDQYERLSSLVDCVACIKDHDWCEIGDWEVIVNPNEVFPQKHTFVFMNSNRVDKDGWSYGKSWDNLYYAPKANEGSHSTTANESTTPSASSGATASGGAHCCCRRRVLSMVFGKSKRSWASNEISTEHNSIYNALKMSVTRSSLAKYASKASHHYVVSLLNLWFIPHFHHWVSLFERDDDSSMYQQFKTQLVSNPG